MCRGESIYLSFTECDLYFYNALKYSNPLSGSLASSIFDPRSALVGASGGVYALMGGYFMNAVVVSRLLVIFDSLELI